MKTEEALGCILENLTTEDGQQGLTDVLQDASNNLERLAGSITPLGVAPNSDAHGGLVSSLTEAVMGVTGGLCRIADAIQDLADAVRDRSEDEDDGE